MQALFILERLFFSFSFPGRNMIPAKFSIIEKCRDVEMIKLRVEICLLEAGEATEDREVRKGHSCVLN